MGYVHTVTVISTYYSSEANVYVLFTQAKKKELYIEPQVLLLLVLVYPFDESNTFLLFFIRWKAMSKGEKKEYLLIRLSSRIASLIWKGFVITELKTATI